MVWNPDAPYTPEVEKSRPRLIGYCTGKGLDLGCGIQRVTSAAIGVDAQADVCAASVEHDLNTPMTIFSNESMDYVFSSHLLEHMVEPVECLMDWWSKIKLGGHLVLVLPHRDHYPRMGQPGSNTDHRWDFCPEDIKKLMDLFSTYELVHDEVRSGGDEYSFELVFKKLATERVHVEVPKPKLTGEKALVVRYGGIGDHIIVSPVFRLLKEQGYHVTFNTNPQGMDVTKHNPHIDAYILQGTDMIPNVHLEYFWEKMGAGYDKFVNLSGSLESDLLLPPNDPRYELSHKERGLMFNSVNYSDYAMEKAGFPEAKGTNGEIYFSMEEEIVAQTFRKNLRNRFIVIWALSGSALHKSYPFYMEAMDAFSRKNKEVLFITVGGYTEKLLEIGFEGPNYFPRAGVWDLRNSLAAVKYADLVIGGETGMLNAAGAFDIPKLCFLTHSSHDNLCKYWKNDYSIQSTIDCSPCHRMIYSREQCPWDDEYGCCKCMMEFPPEEILFRMNTVLNQWRRTQVHVAPKIVLPRRGR